MQLIIKNVFIALFISISFHGFAQDKNYNQFDVQGKRNGKWKKYYKNGDQVRYEGQFDHGQETGTFKFYKPKSGNQPAATKTYRPNSDTLVMRFFNKKGFLITKGKLIDKKRVGKWSYFSKSHKGQKVMTEHYKNGKLHGWKTVYFNNGQITEKQHFKNGLKDGKDFIYAKSGTLLQQYNYAKNTLQGESKVYTPTGKLKSEGYYKNGRRHGTWKFYTEGKLDSVQKYPLERRNKNIPQQHNKE